MYRTSPLEEVFGVSRAAKAFRNGFKASTRWKRATILIYVKDSLRATVDRLAFCGEGIGAGRGGGAH